MTTASHNLIECMRISPPLGSSSYDKAETPTASPDIGDMPHPARTAEVHDERVSASNRAGQIASAKPANKPKPWALLRGQIAMSRAISTTLRGGR